MHTVIIYIVCLVFAFKVYTPGNLLAGIDQARRPRRMRGFRGLHREPQLAGCKAWCRERGFVLVRAGSALVRTSGANTTVVREWAACHTSRTQPTHCCDAARG